MAHLGLWPQSIAQVFEGEDLSAGDRKAAQMAQAAAWWAGQAGHKAALRAAQAAAEAAHGDLIKYQVRVGAQHVRVKIPPSHALGQGRWVWVRLRLWLGSEAKTLPCWGMQAPCNRCTFIIIIIIIIALSKFACRMEHPRPLFNRTLCS
jgi:hypothetical protein